MTTETADLEPQLANCREYWLGWGTEDRMTERVSLYRSGILYPLLNGVLRVEDDGSSFDDLITAARDRLVGVPWYWLVGPDSRPGTVDALLAQGAEPASSMPVMAVPLDQVNEVDGPPQLKIEVVDGDVSLREWAQEYCLSFGIPGDVTPHERTRSHPAGSLVRFVGRIGERIVGTAALLNDHGVAGIYVVSAGASFRRQGIGAQLTATALRMGRELGLRLGTLQASELGMPLYERMGFTTVTEYQMFRFPDL